MSRQRLAFRSCYLGTYYEGVLGKAAVLGHERRTHIQRTKNQIGHGGIADVRPSGDVHLLESANGLNRWGISLCSG